MSERDELPALPESGYGWPYHDITAYTADQMRSYAAQQVAAERSKCATIARLWGETHAPHETVNARNAASKIARAIEGHSAAATVTGTAAG